jgi:amino acid adenylation domain-containing protein
MALLALWQVLLARYSGQDDISVGSPIAGRTRSETEGLIGFFVNTLVLRTQVDPRATFRELLAKVRSTTLGAYEHQDVPFEKLVEELRPQRSLSHSPLFQVMLVLQNAPTATLEVKGRAQDSAPLSVESFESGPQATKFDLTLSLAQGPEGLGGSLSYRTDLFEPGTITRLVEHFTMLVQAAVSAPETRVGELSLLPAPERQQLLVRWNDTRQEAGWDGALHERFEQQAARTPDALAVLDDSASLSFAQVNRRANQLARWLRSRGVGPEVRVALCMERGVDMVVAVLAILKAGGAYVPMDPAYPRERLAFMLQDCGALLALTQSHLKTQLEGASVEAVYLDGASTAQALSRESEANPPRVTSPEHLAYVIYTSGSTGRPKGVMVQHASVMNLRAALASAVYAGAEGALRVSLNAPLAFDASVKQLIQVADGHALCVVPQAAREDVSLLKAWVEKHQLDVLDCSPSHLRLLLEEGLASSRPLRVLVGGEAVDEALWAKLSAHPFIQCFNVYGPTECTVDTTARAIRGASRPTLGGPLANVQVYVLDEHMQPVPTGVPGELFIGGAGVARGYLGRPELSAEKFIPDPFGTTAGGRLYRTGDKVRWLANGELDYLGRIDFQVKLRGFRIELGEIETALEQDASVSRAVVLAREDIPGNPRLVAYLVTPEGRTLDTAELRASLLRSLPEYMVPSAFVFLAALPLNTHGKVDRKALPTPDASSTGADYVAPRTPTEEAVAAVWGEVLHVEKVGATDDFFALGGHSLLAVRLMARLRERTGVALPVSALFQGATVERLAQRLEQRDDASRSTSNLVRLDAGTATGRPLFLVHGGGGSVLGYTELVRHLGADRPIYGLSASGIDGGELPAASIEVLARDYLAQLRAVQPQGPYLLGGWSFGGLVAYEMARLLQAAGEQVELLALLDSHAPDAQPRPEPDALMQLAGFGRVLGLPWQSLPLDVEHLRRLDVRGALAYVLEQARRSPSGGLDLDLDAAERLFRVYQRLSHAQRTYVPAGTYTGPAVLLRAATPPSGAPRAQDLGWSVWLPGELTVHEVPGDHFTLLTAPHVTSVVERLAHHLRLLKRDAT